MLFAKQRLRASDTQVGLLFAAGSVGVVVLSLAAGPLRRRWSFSTRRARRADARAALLTIALGARRTAYWLALPLWALVGGLGILFNINTGSLRQAIVPNHLLGRVISIAACWRGRPSRSARSWAAAIQRTGNVALVYGIIGVLTVLIPFGFAFTPLGHAERYLPRPGEEPAAEVPMETPAVAP